MKHLFPDLILLVPTLVFSFISFLYPFIYWPEMFTYPFFLLRGWLPYLDWSMIYTPGFLYVLAGVYKVLGLSPFSMHLFSTVVNSFSVFLATVAIYKLNNSRLWAIISGLVLGLFILAFTGNTVWFEIFLSPFVVILYYLGISLEKGYSTTKIFISGFVLGLMVMVKQNSIYFLIPLLINIIFSIRKNKPAKPDIYKGFIYLVTVLLLWAMALLIYLYHYHLLSVFNQWAVQFVLLFSKIQNTQHTVPSYALFPTFRQFLTLVPFLLVLLYLFKKHTKFVFMASAPWVLASVLFSVPRFDYFHLVPAVFLTTIIIGSKNPRILVLLLLTVLPLLYKTAVLGNRFLDFETISVVTEIKKNYPHKSIFTLNGLEQVYPLTNKLPAVHPWRDPLPWHLEYKSADYHQSFIQSSPDVVIVQPFVTNFSDGLGSYRPESIWQYLQANYHITKVLPGQISFYEKNI